MAAASAERDPTLEAQLARHLDGWTIHAFQRVTSTMEVAHELAAGLPAAPAAQVGGAQERTLVWAAQQEQGRGRLGRKWESPDGGVYLSLILRPSRPMPEVPQLSLVAGLATVEAIQRVTNLFCAIRWPNDLLLAGKKVCGILVEARDGAAVIGIGINVAVDPRELPEIATSLRAAGASADPYHLTGELCRRFAAWYDVWTREGFGPIREALRPWIGIFGQPVHIAAGADRFEGTASDLDDSGRLLVRLDSGLLRPFDMGEVTLLR